MAIANAVAINILRRSISFTFLKAINDKKLPNKPKILSRSHLIYYFCRLVKKAIPHLLMLTAAPVAAQKASTTVQQVWFSYHNQTRLSNKLGLWNDAQLRTRNSFTRDLSIYILRTG